MTSGVIDPGINRKYRKLIEIDVRSKVITLSTSAHTLWLAHLMTISIINA